VMHLDGTSLPVLDDKSPGNIRLGVSVRPIAVERRLTVGVRQVSGAGEREPKRLA
jgi:hypothetical protein